MYESVGVSIPHACRCNGQNPSNGKNSKWHFSIINNTKLTYQDPDKGPTSTTSQKDMHFLACWGTLAILSFWKWNQESSCLTFSEMDICLSSEGLLSADSRDLGEWGSCVSRVFHNYTQKPLGSSCCSINSTARTRLSLFFYISGPSSDTGCFLSLFFKDRISCSPEEPQIRYSANGSAFTSQVLGI